MGQDVDEPPSVSISDYELEAVDEFVYLGSTTPDDLSLDTELNRQTQSGRPQRQWPGSRGESGETTDLTGHTKAQVYMACVVSTLL